jgi:hypothetical protein
MIVLVAGETMDVPFGDALGPPLDELPDELELPLEDELPLLDEDEPPPDELPDELDELLLLLLEELPLDELLPEEDDEELLLDEPELDDDPPELLELPLEDWSESDTATTTMPLDSFTEAPPIS